MCVYSMIVDHYRDKWIPGWPQPSTPWIPSYPPPPKPADIDKQMEEFKKLLERAKEYDKRNNEPDCDLESKKEALRELAKHWGIDISFLNKEGT